MAKNNNIVKVAFISDENYIQPTIVAITSLIYSKTVSNYKIYVIGNNISEKSKELLLSMNGDSNEICYIESDNKYKNMSKENLKSNLSANITALIKFDLANILSDVDKVVYLDCDIIVKKDLYNLYNLQLGDNYIAAVNNYYPLSHIQKLGLHDQHDYYNTGVMVMDLKRIRDDGMSSKLVDYRNNCYNKFMDQDAFNVIFAGRILTLPLIYNMRFDCIAYPNFDQVVCSYYGMPQGITSKELIDQSTILHFCTKQKPWIYQIPYFSELYLQYYKKSPYREVEKELGNYRFGQPLRPIELKSNIEYGKDTIGIFVNISNDLNTAQLCVNSLMYQTINNIKVYLMVEERNNRILTWAQEIGQSDPRFVCCHVPGHTLDDWKNYLKLSECTYCIFLDSIDYLEQNACEFIESVIMKENPDVLVYHPREFLSDYSQFTNIQNFEDNKKESVFRYYAKLYYSYNIGEEKKKFICKNLIYPSTMAYRKDIILKHIDDCESFPTLFYECAIHNKLLYLNLILVNHRKDVTSDFYKQFYNIRICGDITLQKPVVSVVIAAYNCDKYVAQCLRSLIKQTFNSIQIICVNDGSSDNTLNVILEQAECDDRIVVINSIVNEGPAMARNIGLEYARGDFVIFIDADDYCETTMLEKMVDASNQHKADVVICRSYEFDDQTGEQHYVGNMYRDELLDDKSKVFNYKSIPNYIYNIVNGWAWDKLIKRDLLIKHRLRFQDIRRNEDMVFSYMAMTYAKANFLMDDILIFHRRNTGISQEKTGEKYPFTFYEAGVAWIKKLKGIDAFELLEQSYVNRIISALFYSVSMVRSNELLYLEMLVMLKVKILDELKLVGRKEEYFYDFNKDRYSQLKVIEEQSLADILSHGIDSAKNKLMRDYKIINDKLNWYRREKEKSEKKSVALHKENGKKPFIFRRFFSYLKKYGIKKTIRRIFLGKKPSGKKVKNLIVSLTSFPERIKTVHLCIETLLNQNLKPEKIILVLAKEQFPRLEYDLPHELIEQTKRGLTIMWSTDLKSYKKLIPVKKAFPKAVIVTADDDVYYRYDWLRTLYDAYKKNPNVIQCHRASKIIIDNDKIQMVTGGMDVYNEPSYLNKVTGVGGVLYPPECFYKDILDEKLFMKLCPHNDDTWFWLMGALNGYKVNVVKHNDVSLNFIEKTQEGPCLWKVNNRQTNYFYKELNNMFDYYKENKLKELLLDDQNKLMGKH